MIADLHMHSNNSDGTMLPRTIVSCCKSLGIKVMSLTDHDNVGGVREAVINGLLKGVKVIPGIELSSFRDREIHILGYNIDYENENFLKELAIIQDRRENRNLDIVENLKGIGINLDYESMKREKASVGRIHMALQMKDRGYVNSVSEAFEKYIGYGCPCYVKSPLISPEKAIKIINDYKGVAVLAHPYRFIEEGNMRKVVESLPGLSGVEVYYPWHTEAIKEELLKIAEEFNLFVTGGSDFHNIISGSPIGSSNYNMNDRTAEMLRIV